MTGVKVADDSDGHFRKWPRPLLSILADSLKVLQRYGSQKDIKSGLELSGATGNIKRGRLVG